MKFFICVLFSVMIFPQVLDSPITNPVIGNRCKAMLKKREEKQALRQKLSALRKRNDRLQKLTPKNKKLVKLMLIQNKRELIQEIELATFRIQNLEEEIILKGCPGIKL